MKTVLALCFTQVSETYHHWRIFSEGSSGVCISFKKDSLLDAIQRQPGTRMEQVRYHKITEETDEERNFLVTDLPFIKRIPFQDEQEFRILYGSETEVKHSQDIPIPLSCISKITLSPWLSPILVPAVRQALNSIEGCTTLRVSRSTLVNNETWKKFADSAA